MTIRADKPTRRELDGSLPFEVDGDVAIVTFALALAAYGLRLRRDPTRDVIQVYRGPDAQRGDQRAAAHMHSLASRFKGQPT